jgi:ABC-type transport system involved in cytochrome c biogenesis ATPase subunit
MQYKNADRSRRGILGQNECFLLFDNWDDYSYKTSLNLVYFDENGTRHDIGGLKIMQRGMPYGYTNLESPFEVLPADYVSLGQAQDYYESLLEINENIGIDILDSLRDAIWNEDIHRAFAEDDIFKTSLLRGRSNRDWDKFKRIAHEQASLTPFRFRYDFAGEKEAFLEFKVQPKSMPPSNIHVIIGRNGIGKTTLLRSFVKLLSGMKSRKLGRLTFMDENGEDVDGGFPNLVAVAFSAFDEFDPPRRNEGTKTGINYTYIGLRKNIRKGGVVTSRAKTMAELRTDFVQSTLACLRSSRKPRWRAAMAALETDPGFAALRLGALADATQDEFEAKAEDLFTAASSGHKIVLLTMTQLVELVAERTLVLIDEPEAHLHPPLAASFVRALSNLMVHRNGVAVLATHSPVIVQEVPSDCVSLFFRHGDFVEIERPESETFAENIGLLTREIFRVELTDSGYHAFIAKAVEESSTLDEAMEEFNGKIGAEGRALVRALWRER